MREAQFSVLFEEFAKQRRLEEGTDLLAQVRDINENYVVVNAGLKSEAHIPLEEFYNDNKELEIGIGDDVEVEIELLDNGRGESLLSRRNTRRKQAWQSMEDAMKNEGVIEGTITNRVKGGYSVLMNSLRAFLPGSLVDVFPQPDPYAIIGSRLEFRPIKVNAAKNSLVVSRRAVIERTMLEIKDCNWMETLSEGQKFKGTVKATVEYGAFVEISTGVYGLLHITDISWKHTTSVDDVLSVNDEVEVIILGIDKEKGRISLGMKQLQPNPWEFFDRTHPVGSRAFGKVTRVLEYGIFVEVEDGVQGLVHSSEMSWVRKNPNPTKFYTTGDEVEVMILEIDIDRRRISLGIKQCQPNPWQEFAVAYRKGDKVSGKVRSISEFGIFVELPGGIDGLVRLVELSYEQSGEEAVRQYKKEQEIEVVVLSIDAERERISLGIKQLSDSGFESFSEQHLRGTIVRGIVGEIVEKGAHIKLDGGVRAFLPIREISEQHVENITDHLKEGDEQEFILIDTDTRNMQAIVSIKEKDRRTREKALQERKKQAPPKNTLGAMLQAKISEAEEAEEAEEAKGEGTPEQIAAADHDETSGDAENIDENTDEDASDTTAEETTKA
ncbi:MAG: 30S ribosomal protein S1 [Gammaproteobacteria bacterium WSBS_2016_MAG_OTU1]